MSSPGPRTNYCWECGKKLKLPSFAEVVIDGHPRIVHKECANPWTAAFKVEFNRELENAEEKEAYAIPH
jgi:hypothetical protein